MTERRISIRLPTLRLPSWLVPEDAMKRWAKRHGATSTTKHTLSGDVEVLTLNKTYGSATAEDLEALERSDDD